MYEGFWHVKRNFNFDTDIKEIIEALNKDESSAVFINDNTGHSWLEQLDFDSNAFCPRCILTCYS